VYSQVLVLLFLNSAEQLKCWLLPVVVAVAWTWVEVVVVVV
jgi:hypothetical protein